MPGGLKRKLALDLSNGAPTQFLWEFLQFCFLRRGCSSTNFTSTAEPQKGMSMWDAFSCPLSPDWALLSDTLLLFGSHMSDAGQNRIGKTCAILIKLRIWQLTSCCRGWRTTIVGTNYPQLKASTGAFFRFPTVGLHATAVTAGR